MSFKFGKHKLNVRVNKYQNNSLCLTTDLTNGEEWLRLSTNLNNDSQSDTHIFIQKNDEMFDSLVEVMVKQGLLKQLDETATSGYNTYQLYEVLPKCLDMAIQDS